MANAPAADDAKLVSVIMPARNAATTLESTLAALSSQTFATWELCVTDDGSSDGTADLIHRWGRTISQRVSIVRAESEGPSAARNRAVLQGQGHFLAFLDADDLWHPEKLERQVSMLSENSDLDGVTCGYRIVSNDDTQAPTVVEFNWSTLALKDWALLEGKGPALCSTLMLRRQAFESCGGFDSALRNLEDVDIVLRMIDQGSKLDRVPGLLCDYRLFEGQNHTEMSTVKAAVEILVARPPFLTDRKARSRLLANLKLLGARRAWKDGARIQASFQVLFAIARSPLMTSRTILRRMI